MMNVMCHGQLCWAQWIQHSSNGVLCTAMDCVLRPRNHSSAVCSTNNLFRQHLYILFMQCVNIRGQCKKLFGQKKFQMYVLFINEDNRPLGSHCQNVCGDTYNAVAL